MATEKTLSDAFYETLKDLYYAEKQSVRALTKSAKIAKADALKQAFDQHREESAHQVERLEQVFDILGKPARTKTCEAMQGIVHEMQEDMDEFGGTEANDAVLIGCAQAVEHYEMARYGLLKTWATQLGMTEAAALLDETLEEEKAADLKLTQIAEGGASKGSPTPVAAPAAKTSAKVVSIKDAKLDDAKKKNAKPAETKAKTKSK